MAWYNTSWRNRIKITVDHAKLGSADVSNFPVYVNLADLPASFWALVNSNGGDIRVTTSDGTTECPLEMVAIDTSAKTGEIYFKAPTLSHTTDTDFYIYYRFPGATQPAANSTYGSQNVWDANFMGVYHLEANGNDSTANARNLTNNNTVAFNVAKAGKGADGGASNTNKYLSISSNNLGINGDTNTMEIWTKLDAETSSSDYSIIEQVQNTNKIAFQLQYQHNGGSRRIYWARNRIGAASATVVDPGNMGTANFYYIVGTYDAAAAGLLELLVNNASQGTTTQTGDGTVAIGDSFNLLSGQSGGNYASAIVDETRISNIKRAATWLTATYNNINTSNTFYALGSQEGLPIGLSLIKSFAVKRAAYY